MIPKTTLCPVAAKEMISSEVMDSERRTFAMFSCIWLNKPEKGGEDEDG